MTLAGNTSIRTQFMDDLDLLIDLHVRNARQAPGSDESTQQAITLARLDPKHSLKIADLGCGTGASTLTLAKVLPNAEIVAVDMLPAFVERLGERLAAAGVCERVTPVPADMADLSFDDAEFDVIWSEGAIYNIGFEDGARLWRRHLRPNGRLVVSELTWTTPERPQKIADHWTQEYPGIGTVRDNLQRLERAGYQPTAFFFLPDRCWTDHYHGPLEISLKDFVDRHESTGHGDAARRLAESELSEADLWRRFGRWYGYAFYVARVTD
jgi:SAM-dependent methyltransferase